MSIFPKIEVAGKSLDTTHKSEQLCVYLFGSIKSIEIWKDMYCMLQSTLALLILKSCDILLESLMAIAPQNECIRTKVDFESTTPRSQI